MKGFRYICLSNFTMGKLDQKIIVVTGGSGLLGKALMERISAEGGTVINGDMQGDANNAFAFIPLDITQEASITNFIQQVLDQYGRIDGWVNNAYPRTEDWGTHMEDAPLSSWKDNIDMHLNGYYACCKHALIQMKNQGYGSLVNMSSIYGMNGPDFTVYEGTEIINPVAYSAIKGGILNLSRYLASYYGKYQVRVNCVSPGGIFDHQPKPFVEAYSKKTPLKRMGTPEEIAPSICFLLSDEARYITGHNLVVDGGWSIV
jgi:NAD(P)-dependent dehydrogenase (short-subunit alcohol dehydrogenase family)